MCDTLLARPAANAVLSCATPTKVGPAFEDCMRFLTWPGVTRVGKAACPGAEYIRWVRQPALARPAWCVCYCRCTTVGLFTALACMSLCVVLCGLAGRALWVVDSIMVWCRRFSARGARRAGCAGNSASRICSGCMIVSFFRCFVGHTKAWRSMLSAVKAGLLGILMYHWCALCF